MSMMKLLSLLARRGKGYAHRCETPGFGMRPSDFSLMDRNQIAMTSLPSFCGCSEGFKIDLDYLRAKGYGQKSPQEIRELRKELGLLKTSNEQDDGSMQDVDEEFGACEIDMVYLRAKGYGHKSPQEIRELRKELGLLKTSDEQDGGSMQDVDEKFGACKIETLLCP